MDVEVALLKKQMQECGEVHTTAFSSMEFIEGVIGQTSVVVVKCGVGMVNAATCTQILIDRFGVGAVLNTGIAGSLDAAIEELGADYTEEEIRLVRIKFMSEMGN